MRIFCFFILLAFNSKFLFSQSYSQLIRKADSLYKSMDYINSMLIYEKALKLKTENAWDFYNAACATSLAGQSKKAIGLLNLSIDKGYASFSHLKNDTDLISLYNLPSWNVLVKRIDTIEGKYNKEIQKELLEILDSDQKPRNKVMTIIRLYGRKDHRVDSIDKIIDFQDSVNLIKVKAIISQHGWIGPELVGEEANTTLFLIIQHSDLTTQEEYLPIMKAAVKRKAAKSNNVALLEDRIAMKKGKKQIYGSQVRTDEKTNKYYVYPIEDPSNVDKRRDQVGLEPLSEYLRKYNIIWDAKMHLAESDNERK